MLWEDTVAGDISIVVEVLADRRIDEQPRQVLTILRGFMGACQLTYPAAKQVFRIAV